MINTNSMLLFQLIRDFLTVYLTRQKASSPNTVKAYRDSLNLLFEYLKEEQNISLKEISFERISRTSIEHYLDWLENRRDCCVSTRNHRLSCIRAFYKYAGNMDLKVTAYALEMEKIPLKKVSKSQPLKFFSEDALKAILAQPDTKTLKGTRDLFYMILMYDCGARNQEILDLKVSDIHATIQNPYVIINGKGNKTRLVPLMDKVVDHFTSYVRLFHNGELTDDLLFYIIQKDKKQAMSPDNVAKFMKKYGDKAKIKCNSVPEGLHPHMFRHSRAMHLYHGGMPLPLLSEWLGHAQVETTMIYAYADTQMKRDAIEKATSNLNPLLQSQPRPTWQDDEALIKRLYGLV
jgi:integrase/recombinase XerD